MGVRVTASVLPRLDFSGEYEAFVVSNRTGYTYRLPWTSISWQRRRNDISEASVTTAPIDGPPSQAATEVLRAIEPWGTELRIERNASLIWSGPIVGFSREQHSVANPGSVTVKARDRAAVLKRRIVAVDRTFASTGIGSMLSTLIADAFAVAGSGWTFTTQVGGWVTSGGSVYKAAQGQNLWDAIAELSERGITWTMLPEVMWGPQAWLQTQSDAIGLFTDAAFVGLPSVEVDGLEMANQYLVGVGPPDDAGFTVIGDYSLVDSAVGLLQTFEGRDDLTDINDADTYAYEQYQRFRYPRISLSDAQLSSAAPITWGQLLPGVNISVSFDESSMLGLTDLFGSYKFGLDTVDVSVSTSANGVSEVVKVSLGPPTVGLT